MTKVGIALLVGAVLLGLGWGLWRGGLGARPGAESTPPPVSDVSRDASEPIVRREVAPPPELRQAPQRVSMRSHLADLNNRAVAALEAGELDEALALLEQCVAGDASEPVFRRNLAEALTRVAVRDHERVRPCLECVETLARALELAPEREGLAALLERWRRELETESEFHRVQSQHFELAYEVWREGLLDRTADILEALELHYVELALVFGVRPAEAGRARIPVSLYRPAEFSRITGLAEWAGASYDGVIRAPVAEDRAVGGALDELLRHELIHAFVRELGGRSVPGWLNEGLAQWFQRAPAPEVQRARAALRGKAPLELTRLEGTLTKLSDASTIALAYAQSLAFCAWIDQQYGRAVLVAMVAGCGRDERVEATFQSWTRVPLAEAFALFLQGL